MRKQLSGSVLGWMAPAVLAMGLGFGAMAPAHAQDLTRVLVDVADVVFNNGTPYYRYGDNGNTAPLVVGRDAYGRPVYYRQLPYNNNPYGNSGYGANPYNQRGAYDRQGRPVYDQYGRRIDYSRDYSGSRNGPPYGNAYGYYRNGPGSRGEHCNKHGKCKGNERGRDHDGDRYGNRDGNRDWNDGRRGGDDDDND